MKNDNHKWAQWLPGMELRISEPMASHTTMRVGGPADCMLLPRHAEDISRALLAAQAEGFAVTILGNGSNLIVRDGGLRGLVIKIGQNAQAIEPVQGGLYAQAGASMRAVGNAALAAGLSGFEALHGIPGYVGGAVYMNAGAYGQEMAQVVTSVDAVTMFGDPLTLSGEDMRFSYRHSEAQTRRLVVLGARLSLVPGDVYGIRTRMEEYANARSSKQPLELPSAGSVFKRPEGHFTGQLIEQSGLKGFAIGGAQVSPKHAGFIVNTGGATAADVLALIDHIIQTVRRDHGVTLEPEVRILGEDPANH